jgi:hypothetical protein
MVRPNRRKGHRKRKKNGMPAARKGDETEILSLAATINTKPDARC